MELSPVIRVADGSPGEAYWLTDHDLLDLVRSGNSYLDVHLGADPDRVIRYDITNPVFQDWSEKACST